MRSKYYKTAQRLLYNIFVEKWILAILVVGTILVTISLLHFGETAMEWSREKYSEMFKNVKDNLRDTSFQEELTQMMPIDVVYTWVNGSDPQFLKDLKTVKEELDLSGNDTVSGCRAGGCVVTHLVMVGCEAGVKLEYVRQQNKDMVGVEQITQIQSQNRNITLFSFSNPDQALAIQNKSEVHIGTSHYAMSLTYWTTDWTVPHSVPMDLFVIATQVPSPVSAAILEEALHNNFNLSIAKTWLYPHHSLAVLQLYTNPDVRKLIGRQLSMENHKILRFYEAHLILKLPSMEDDRISAMRFTDNEELRYSLRSLEKYAGWVRHVYLVTNGQIPYWLNMDCPKLTLVTHQEIFKNTSALPTFSSPAIESNLHHIPGMRH